NIYRALRQPGATPEERRREVEAEAGRRIEEQQRRRRTPKKGEERRRQETDAKLEEEKALAAAQPHPRAPLATQVRGQPRRAFRLSVLLAGAALVIGAGIIWLATGWPSLRPSPSYDTPLSPEREAALKPRDSFKECGTCPQMVVVPTGNFTMGSPDDEPGRNTDET